MSRITLSGNASGTGTFTIASPNSNTDRTLTLPDAAGTVVTDTATQTLTNKSIQGGALTLGTAQASTSGTAIDFTGIPSWAKRVTVMFNGVSTNGTSIPILRLGSGSFLTSGYLSYAFSTQGSVLATSSFTDGMGLQDGWGADVILYGVATLHNISGSTWVFAATYGSSNLANNRAGSAGGTVTLAGALDRVRITTQGGANTFDAGTINIMWEG